MGGQPPISFKKKKRERKKKKVRKSRKNEDNNKKIDLIYKRVKTDEILRR